MTFIKEFQWVLQDVKLADKHSSFSEQAVKLNSLKNIYFNAFIIFSLGKGEWSSRQILYVVGSSP